MEMTVIEDNDETNERDIFMSHRHDEGDFASMLLFILMKRFGNHVRISIDDAAQLPKGWKDQQLVVERKNGVLDYKLEQPAA